MNKKIIDWLICQNEFGENLILTRKDLALLDCVKKHAESLQDKRTNFEKFQSSSNLKNVQSQSYELESTAAKIEYTKVVSKSTALLAELKNKICSFDGCTLKQIATNTVFADGDPNSDIMFIGEAPGAEEDKQGLPFVGKSGQLLNKMIESIGLKRSDVYITNVVNWRPPGNRPPTMDEINQCLPFLKQHIQLISPKILVLLGSTAMKAVLNTSKSLSVMRGAWHQYDAGNSVLDTIVTFHPSYLLRVPSQKKLAWQDFLMIKDKLVEV
ncbi:MAG: uracil-DNA glycosylase [Holosporales bacterium]|jgi:DNA polymerase|nr:uracil-DNA glycosylase [Holosporales bacterium]